MKPLFRPASITGGQWRSYNYLPDKLYTLVSSINGYQKYNPKFPYIACLFQGHVRNYPAYEVLAAYPPVLGHPLYFGYIESPTFTECECGKEKHGFFAHSDWCPKYERNA